MNADGIIVAGIRLQNAAVQPRDHQAVLSGSDGTFTFITPSKTFSLQKVFKHGYVLADPDILSRQFSCSPSPLVIVLEKPEEQLEDRLIAERKIRRTLQRQLQAKEDELDSLRMVNQIAESDYRQALQELYAEQESNESLINDMVERYSKLDFDALNETNREISRLILEGRLSEADSLINSKGNLDERANNLRKLRAANDREEQQLKKRQKALDKRKSMAQDELDDIAQDCYNKFEIFKIQHQTDSATVYLQYRSSLDTSNIQWQLDVSWYLRQYVGDYDTSLFWAQRALNNAIAFHGKESPMTKECYEELGRLFEDLGNYDSALLSTKEVLAISEHIHINEDWHPDLAVGHSRVSMIYYDLGQYKEAKEECEKALRILDSIPYDFEERSIIYNAAGLLFEELENYEDALYYQQKALDSDICIFGEKHPALITRYNNLGTVYVNINDLGNALKYLTASLDLAESLYDDVHPTIATCLNNIGTVYYLKKEYDNSLPFFRRSLDVRLKLFNEIHPDIASSYLNIGNAYGELKQYAESEHYIRKAIEIKSIIYGDDHPDLAGTYNSLGMTLLNQKKYDEALPLFEKALRIRIDTYGEKSVKVSLCYINIGKLFSDTGDNEKAIIYYRKAIHALPDGHPYIETLEKAIQGLTHNN